MILIINVCSQKLHYFEFVKPIERVVRENFQTTHYTKLNDELLNNAQKVIICGTSLQDESVESYIDEFKWLNDFNKPVLGICAGMQIIATVFDATLSKHPEIGFYDEVFTQEFLGLTGKHKVYHLHNFAASLPDNFTECTQSDIPQAIKHKNKSIFGVLFHPEVRQDSLIAHFVHQI